MVQVQGVDFTIQHKPGTENVVPDALSQVILEFASNHSRRTTISEQPIATLTLVLEPVVEPQAPYDSKDDVAISYDSLANLDDVHHGAASDWRASIDHVASITPTDFSDRDGEKEKVWYNSVYSTIRSSPYYSLDTPLLPICGFSGCLILCLICHGKLFVTQARPKSDISCKPRRYSNSGAIREYSDLLANRCTN
jgi:hypothetical protein